MSIPFACPHCGKQIEVSDEYGGKTGPCVQCGKSVTLPMQPAPVQYVPRQRSSSKRVSQAIVFVIVLGVVVVCGGILTSLIYSAKTAANRPACLNNMKLIALAMAEYHEVHGSFPPAYSTDDKGNRLHSWRVLILPYLEGQRRYNQIDLEQPWDSPHNQAFADMMPGEYTCPSSSVPEGSATTSYAMIVGPDTISDGPTARNIEEISDGASSTLMLVEVDGSGINWMEPRDLDARAISFAINDGTTPGIRSDHRNCINAAMCDGSVYTIPSTISPKDIKAMSTIDGGENVSLDTVPGHPQEIQR